MHLKANIIQSFRASLPTAQRLSCDWACSLDKQQDFSGWRHYCPYVHRELWNIMSSHKESLAANVFFKVFWTLTICVLDVNAP